jgi:hypothetical protein
MTKRTFLLGAILWMAFSTAALAADVTGKWKTNFEGPMGSMEITFTFQASGEQLAGTVTNPMGGEDKIQEGKVKGDEISFFIVAGEGQFKINYTGKVAGDELRLTMSFGGGDMPPFEVTAKRIK